MRRRRTGGLARKTPEEGPCSLALRFPVSAFLFLFTPIAAYAQSAAAQTPPTIHETVVVTATGRETPESKVGASITVLNRDAIEQRHALSTIDLLRTIPGIVAVRSGGVGNLTGLFVRGGESTYNKVLLDGMPLNEPGGAFNFASLSPENIERIEVLRGAHSALFGSDAMASVIQLFSVRPDTERPQLNLTVDGGTYNTAHLAAGVGARTGGIEYSVFGSRLQTDNREPNNENRTSTVSGSVTRSLSLGRVGAVSRARRVRTGRHTRARRRSAVPTWTRSSATATAASWADGINRSDRASRSRRAIPTSSRNTARRTWSPTRPTRRGSATSWRAFPSSDFLYDSETELAAAPLRVPRRCGGRTEPDVDGGVSPTTASAAC